MRKLSMMDVQYCSVDTVDASFKDPGRDVTIQSFVSECHSSDFQLQYISARL